MIQTYRMDKAIYNNHSVGPQPLKLNTRINAFICVCMVLNMDSSFDMFIYHEGLFITHSDTDVEYA